MKWFVVLGMAFLALFMGLATAFAGPIVLVAFLPLAMVIGLVFDYRIAVVFLALAISLSSSALLPQAQGLNPISYAIFGAFLVLVIKNAFKSVPTVWPPLDIALILMVPIVFGALLAVPHLGVARQNMGAREFASTYETFPFLKQYILRPFYFLMFAFLVANAVKESKRPERFVFLFSVAALVPSAVVFLAVALAGANLEVLQSQRGFLSGFGLHSNEFGKLLAFAFGPLLFAAFASKGIARTWFVFALTILLAAIIFTFTRAAYISVFITVVIFLWQRKQVGLILGAVSLVVVLAVAAPKAVVDRVTTGTDSASISATKTGEANDKLTAGRIAGNLMLFPEVLKSPIWGSGTGSTAWSYAVSKGLYLPSHPHNMYLALLMDVGLLGFCVALYFYYRFGKALRALAQTETVPSLLRAFFGGAWASLVGMMFMALSGGQWVPHPEQSFLWLTFGITLAYWSEVAVNRKKRGEGRRYAWGIKPMNLASETRTFR
ncbi:hypothetical protein DBR47_03640 [Paucibacter sp. KBW04]|uniref:O-antigen ligase family protein n=1 Tax=Paucibacter sp. KBW04 TaxID=2153361 RepID=UPI000F58EA1A|nr:O-antigen ligase family protein [Paucibacter sp. KBW04]RQO62351.1 hypothetical protein DBR47_03640 [Paucibacter sp. KBW04]